MTRTSRCSAYLWLLSKVRSFHSWRDFSAFGSTRLERGGNYRSYQDLCMQGVGESVYWEGRETFERQNCYKDWLVREVPSVILSHQSHMFLEFFVLFPLLSLHPWPVICHSSVGSDLCPQFQYLPTQLLCQMKHNLHTVPHPLLRKY